MRPEGERSIAPFGDSWGVCGGLGQGGEGRVLKETSPGSETFDVTAFLS